MPKRKSDHGAFNKTDLIIPRTPVWPEIVAGQKVLAMFGKNRQWKMCTVVAKLGYRYRLRGDDTGMEFSTIRPLMRLTHD